MTRPEKYALSARAALALGAMLTMAGCVSQDSQSPQLPPDVVSLAPGQGTTVVGANTLKIDGGSAGSENILVVTDTATTSVSSKLAYSIAATNANAPGTISGPATALLPEGSPSGAVSLLAGPRLDLSFGARLNERSRARLARSFTAARAAYAARNARSGVSRSVTSAAPQVGDIVQLNVGESACDSIVTHAARIVAIGAKSIVLADTLNPSGGFSSADYQRFATRFDTLVYPLDVANFGAPADIDQNGKIELLFTSAVNELTPRNSSSYVGGFFYDRDLFPTASNQSFEGCAGSNVGELFYLLAPDPTGAVNGNIRRTGFVDSITTSILAHEFQHLINASRRLYVTQGAEDFEVVWLNEGLSHVAEELLFYREAGLQPRQNIGINQLRTSTQTRTAYNSDMSSNLGRYESYLEAPSESSPLRNDDSLETRGATWSFLRYAADRKSGSSGSDATIWQALVNSTTTGVANLRNVFGADIGGWLRDWSVSNYTDDLASGAPPEYTQPSWNFRNIFPALTGASATYPLKVNPLVAGAATGTLIGGSAAYYRFAIPPSTTATINVTGATPIQAVVVRVR